MVTTRFVRPSKHTRPGAAPAIVWLRQDLRLADNPALQAACRRGGPVVPVFIWAPEEEGAWPPGGASRWWLHQSLAQLAEELRAAGRELVIRRGASLAELLRVAKATGADAVFWNRRYEPASIARDRQVEEALRADGLEAESFNGALLHEPWTIQNKAGQPFQVFTPFWRTCLAAGEPGEPLPAPRELTAPPDAARVAAAGRAGAWSRRLNWAAGLRAAWQPGQRRRQGRAAALPARRPPDYDEDRNRPDLAGTSRLSPHLHFGEISPRQVWHAVRRFAESQSIPAAAWRSWQFLTELGWREFAHHLLFHFPHTPEQPLRAGVRAVPVAEEPGVAARLAAGPHRLPARGRRHARALGHRLDAQPRADDRRVVPREEPAAPLAGRRALVLGHAGGCRPRQQHARLAMDRRLRRRCRALLPHLQPGQPGREVRP